MPRILAAQSFVNGFEATTSILMHYAESCLQGVVTSTAEKKNGASNIIVIVVGKNGFIEVDSSKPSHPRSFTVYPKWTSDEKPEGKKYDFARPQQGLIYEADNVLRIGVAHSHRLTLTFQSIN